MRATSGKASISIAALGDVAKNSYAIRLVNNEPAGTAHLTGLPAAVKFLRVER